MPLPMIVAPSATASDTRAPWISRLNTSRPIMSAPIRYTGPGAASDALALVLKGSSGATAEAKIAASTNTIMMIPPATPSG